MLRNFEQCVPTLSIIQLCSHVRPGKIPHLLTFNFPTNHLSIHPLAHISIHPYIQQFVTLYTVCAEMLKSLLAVLMFNPGSCVCQWGSLISSCPWWMKNS